MADEYESFLLPKLRDFFSAERGISRQPVRPLYAWEREPEKYAGDVTNPPERPRDYMAPVADLISPTMGAYGMGAAAGETANAVSAHDWAGAVESAAPLMAMAIGPGVKVAPKGRGIKAYHGSPHDFDRFSSEHIGKGEGAQAYGHGLYFAEEPDVARAYRDKLGPITGANKTLIDELRANPSMAPTRLAEVNAKISALEAQAKQGGRAGKRADTLIAIEQTRRHDIERFIRDGDVGRLYEVRINAQPEQFLDWDKPLSEQSEAVRRAFGDFGVADAEIGSRAYDLAGRNLKPPPADDNSWTSVVNIINDTTTPSGRVAVGQELSKRGIPGIRYKDAMSRGADEGTYNYVVFDDSLIDIVKKYGIAGAAAMLGVEASDIEAAMAQKSPRGPLPPPVPQYATGGAVKIPSLPHPTEAQKEAGNYKKGHLRVHGLDITIENPKGSTRAGTDGNGKRWSVEMPAHYGYFKRSVGRDGDHVDCYLGPHPDSDTAFIVDQIDANSGRFDEHKVMLGYLSEKDALRDYRDAFSDGKGAARIGAVTRTTIDGLKRWLADGDTTKRAAIQRLATGGRITGGALHSHVPGRTDHLPLQVEPGAYVVPADVVSALGEGNTRAGMTILREMFPETTSPPERASGGSVPIMAAGGEFVISPAAVKTIGEGDIERGHAVLDKWVKKARANTIKTLQKLPGPAK